jgi:hypothetical protein
MLTRILPSIFLLVKNTLKLTLFLFWSLLSSLYNNAAEYEYTLKKSFIFFIMILIQEVFIFLNEHLLVYLNEIENTLLFERAILLKMASALSYCFRPIKYRTDSGIHQK